MKHTGSRAKRARNKFKDPAGFQETPDLSHGTLIDFMKEFGYASYTGGVCYGYAIVGLQAMLLRECHIFNRRLKWMSYLYFKADDLETEAVSSASKQGTLMIDEKPFLPTQEDRRIIAEIPAFLEALEMHFQPEYYRDWFEIGQAPHSQNIHKTLTLMLPDKLRTATPCDDGVYQRYDSRVVHAASFEGTYLVSELEDYFKSLLLVVKRRKASVALLLCSVGHTMSVGYCLKDKCWYFADVCNKKIQKQFSCRDMASSVNFFFANDNDTSILSTQLFGLDQSCVDNVLMEWRQSLKWQRIHPEEWKRFSMEDWHDISLLHLAAQRGNRPLVERILAEGKKAGYSAGVLLSKCSYEGTPPFMFALEEGHADLAEWLWDQLPLLVSPFAASLTSMASPLNYAVLYHREELVRKLVKAGVDVNRRCPVRGGYPLADAVISGNLTMVRLLLQLGAKAEQASLYHAIHLDNVEIVKTLVIAGRLVNEDHLEIALEKKHDPHLFYFLSRYKRLQWQLGYDGQYANTPRYKAIIRLHQLYEEGEVRSIQRLVSHFKALDDLAVKQEALLPKDGTIPERYDFRIPHLIQQGYQEIATLATLSHPLSHIPMELYMLQITPPVTVVNSNRFFAKRKKAEGEEMNTMPSKKVWKSIRA